MKKKAILDYWRHAVNMSVGGDVWTLYGMVFDHPEFENGSYIWLSRITSFDKEKMVVETLNTTYHLGHCADGNLEKQIQYIEEALKKNG